MMYNNKLVAVIKVNGKILRESGEAVHIPFGSEYEIHFKNLHSTSAVVSVDIDGKDVLDGCQLVVSPNSDNKIEGFMRGMSVSHKFKFIEKTQEISDYRGDDISDGLIRISFQFEEPVRQSVYNDSNWGTLRHYTTFGGCTPKNGTGDRSIYSYQSINTSSNVGSSVSNQLSVNDAGITVNGGSSDQSFVTTTVRRLLPEIHIIVFQLKGETASGVVKTPILVKTKVTCDSCGRRSLLKNKFCVNCGTSLVI